MPNWPSDEDDYYPLFSHDERKRGVMRTPEQQVRKTWNGNPVRTMDSDHIMNAILYCERKFSEATQHHVTCHGVEEDFYFKDVFDMFPEYINLRDEWERRMKND